MLRDSFLQKYKMEKPLQPLGNFVFYRTYSRWLPDLGRLETWFETASRAVNYNCSLDKSTTHAEAEELFDNVFNLRSFLSGRTFWIGGTNAVKDHALANFNCSGVVLDSFQKLKELFYALMVGSGVGFRVLKEDVEHLPHLRHVDITQKEYNGKELLRRLESTTLTFEDNKKALIEIGDSKEGWTQALEFFFNIITRGEYKHVEEIIINYDSVRPKGERLIRFGGTASGHSSLKNMFTKIDLVIKNRLCGNKMAKIEAIDMLDFANIIAENVVVGGVRRSAEIGIFGIDQDECVKAKNSLYTQDENGSWIVNQDIIHRALSNNTIVHFEKPTRDFWKWQFQQMRFSGEPAFYNGKVALERNADFKLPNPCGEILLDDRQTCNLVTNNVMGFVVNGKLDTEALYKAQRLNARASYRMTLVELELPEWNYKLHRDRLLGVSLTGWQDMVNATSLSREDEKTLLQKLRTVAQNGANEIADELGLNRSKLVTTVKPEGTLSLLPTVSSGLHYSHSQYYVRRIRINANDQLVKICKDSGYPIFPEVGQSLETASTLVIEFPVKAPKGRTKYDVSALEQLENYKMFMENYADHNASITVSVRDNEWDDAEEWVFNNWDSCIGITFISLDDNFYSLLPYEAITEKEYNIRRNGMTDFIVSGNDLCESDDTVDTDCVNGACPVR